MSEWISVKDRLPNMPGDVLILCGYYDFYIAFYSDGKDCTGRRKGWYIKEKYGYSDEKCSGHLFEVLYWMPIPEPPKEDEK